MINFRCQECGKRLKADEKIIGRQVKCTRCESVETVPKSDNLAKPKQSKTRLAANKPKPVASRFSDSKTVNLDQPVELFGHSAVGATTTESFEPRFNIATPKKSQTRRLVLFGFIGVFVVAVIAVVMNLGWIMDVRRRFSMDYENLQEVVYYRNSLMKLEKSRRMMYIAGRNYIVARLGTDEEAEELEEFNASVEALTDSSGMIAEVESLYRAGEDKKAASLLIRTAKEMIELRKEVDLRTKQYQEMTNAP